MSMPLRVFQICSLGAALLLSLGCNSLMARQELKAGVQAFRSVDYEHAADHFQRAVLLDDRLTIAKLDLGNTYAMMWIPGHDTPQNNHVWQQAIVAYQSVLAADPRNITALKSIAGMYFLSHKVDEARRYFQQVIQADPNDAEGYYAAAVLEWMAAYRDVSERRNDAGLVKVYAENAGTPLRLCSQIQLTDGQRIEDGLKMAQTATEKRAGYRDALAYIGLLYQLKALSDCDPQAAAQDNTLAANFMERAARTPEQHLPSLPLGPNEVPALFTVPPPPPPPPPPQPAFTSAPPGEIIGVAHIRLPPGKAEINLIHKVEPVYPEMAKVAHIQGDVTLSAVIDKDGTVKDVKAVSGHPILMQSALDAVRQWRYRPFLLDGEPTAFETTITIKFHM